MSGQFRTLVMFFRLSCENAEKLTANACMYILHWLPSPTQLHVALHCITLHCTLRSIPTSAGRHFCFLLHLGFTCSVSAFDQDEVSVADKRKMRRREVEALLLHPRVLARQVSHNSQ